MSLLDLASLVLAPTATKEGKVYSAIPDTGDGDMTFTRGSAATRVNSEGLIEKERANLLTYSNDFSNAAWTKSASTITADALTSPQGATNASYLTDNTANNFHGLYAIKNISSVVTCSIFVKYDNKQFVSFLTNNNGASDRYAYFDLVNKTTHNISSGLNAMIEDVGSGWLRLSVMSVSSANGYYWWNIAASNSSTAYIGDGTGRIGIFGSQLEQGLVATDYIETTTTAVYEGITDDVPRVDYSGGGCPSLLLEPSRTQLLPHSEYFGAYSVNNGTATANEIISPEGILNAYQFTENTGTSAHYIDTTNISVTSGNSYVISLFAKYDGRFLTIQGSSSIISSNYATFNLQTGVVEEENIGDASIEDYGNGWYRCIFKITATGTGSGAITILLNDSATGGRSRSYTGDGESGIYIYGFQVEAGSYVSSYINSYGTSTTRVADSCSKTGISELIGQSEGTLFFDFVYDGDFQHRFSIANNANTDNWIFMSIPEASNGNGRVYVRINSVIYIDTSSGLSAVFVKGQRYKVAFGYQSGDWAVYINGLLKSSGSETFTSAVGMDAFYLSGTSPTGTNQLSKANIDQAILFPTRLTNDQLAELTT